MGLYSQLGSLCSMLATLQVGVITYRVAHNKRLPSKRAVTAASVSIFVLCTIISLLPLAGATKPYALSRQTVASATSTGMTRRRRSSC